MSELIKVKTNCPHFLNVGNVCSRVDGMARCDEYSECEFKYIDALKEENKKLKEKIGYLQQVLLKIKDLAMCGGDCEHDCDHCMQGQIHQLIKCTNAGCRECECTGICEEYLLKIIRGKE